MMHLENMPQLSAKITVLGNGRDEFVKFVTDIGMKGILSADTAEVAVVMEEGLAVTGYGKVVYPYCEGYENSVIGAERMLTYAVENNNADVVAKNIREREGFATFELLAEDGIGRVYVDGDIEKVPKQALALACGLMLSGVPTREAISSVSSK